MGSVLSTGRRLFVSRGWQREKVMGAGIHIVCCATRARLSTGPTNNNTPGLQRRSLVVGWAIRVRKSVKVSFANWLELDTRRV